MDEVAEQGFAAHWKYKEGDINVDDDNELNNWLSTIKEILDDPQPDAMDFLDTIKLNLFASEIFVFTPKGEIKTMPAGCTVLDFAFLIHTFLGTHCIGAKVNHKLVPLSHKLQSGDQVEILTSKSQHVQPSWINFVSTAKARGKIQVSLRRINREKQKEGEQILTEWLKANDREMDMAVVSKLCALHGIEKPDDLFLNIGKKTITLGNKELYALNDKKKEIIDDHESRCIVVAAGPGSGKTRVLVHKLASLLLLEDVKHEQLLMLTFSRAAATEFKQRLMQLIGNAAHFVEIKTFHSYCFDLLGRVGNLDEAGDVVKQAAEMINNGEVEPNRISKTVLVIDEAQDMSKDDYALVSALMKANEEMRVIAVGDDDQNIYEFRGSNSQYLYELTQTEHSRFIEMTENYRSLRHIVDAANDFARNIRQRIKSTPIISMSQEDGEVRIVKHPYEIQKKKVYMYQPILEDVTRLLRSNASKKADASSRKKNETISILTQTNEEAVIMLALLHSHGIKAKLVQSMDGLRFWNLAEVRYFLKKIDQGIKETKSPIIPDDIWEAAKQQTFQKYATSQALPYLRRSLQIFEQTNRAKYYSDLREFVFESSVEDFCDISKSDIVVSTIHKAKGHEFDHVLMLITHPEHPTDDILRRYYVGMTRAKRTLAIHTNGNLFDSLKSAQHLYDAQAYDEPKEIVLQLSHKDVNLGFSKPHKDAILCLRSGMPLTYHDHCLCLPSTGRDIAQLSIKMKEKLGKWELKGYKVTAARIRFIVAWKSKDAPRDEKESAIVLADLVMKK